MRAAAALIILAFLLLRLAAVNQPASGGKVYGLFFGSIPIKPGAPVLKFAERDATRVRKAFAGRVTDQKLTAGPVTADQIRTAMISIRERSTVVDTIVIFISAPGLASDKGQDQGEKSGIVVPSQGTREKPHTLLTLKELQTEFQLWETKSIIVMMDVQRDTFGEAGLVERRWRDNRVNTAVAEYLLRDQRVGLLLSTERDKLSRENPTRESGVFAYNLAMAAPSAANLRNLELQTSKALDGYEQITKRDGENWPLPPHPGTRISGFFRLVMHGPVSVQAQDKGTYEHRIVSGSAEDAERALALFERHRLQQATSDERSSVSAALEARGDFTILNDTVTDRFPDDPLKPSPEEMMRAAKLFETAHSILAPAAEAASKKTATDLMRRMTSLQAKALYCTARGLPDDSRQARDLLEKAAIREPNSPEITNARGVWLLNNAREDRRHVGEAAKYFREAARQAPLWAYPRHNLALALMEQGDYDGAEESWRAAIRNTPHYPYLYSSLGLLRHRRSDLRSARRLYTEAIAIFDERLQETQARLNAVSAENNRPAAEYLTKLIASLRRNRAETVNALGAVYLFEENYEKAKEHFRRVLKEDAGADPAGHVVARYNLAQTLLAQIPPGETAPSAFREVITTLKANVETTSPDRRSQWKLATIYRRIGQYTPALKHLREVTEAQPDNYRALIELAEITQSQGGDGAALLRKRIAVGKLDPNATAKLHQALSRLEGR